MEIGVAVFQAVLSDGRTKAIDKDAPIRTTMMAIHISLFLQPFTRLFFHTGLPYLPLSHGDSPLPDASNNFLQVPGAGLQFLSTNGINKLRCHEIYYMIWLT